MIKLAVTAGSIVVSLLMILVFSYSLNIVYMVVAAAVLSILAVLRDNNVAKQSLIALDLLFMILILLVLGLNGKWETGTLELFLFFISLSSIVGSVESIIFSSKKGLHFLNLLFTVFFWAPLAIPIYYIILPKGGQATGLAAVGVLLFIVYRDIKRRKKSEKEE